jgi:hypothetical protein
MAIRITDGATKMLSVRAATSHAVLRHMIGPFLRRAELVGRLEVGSNDRGTYTTLRRKADDGLAPQKSRAAHVSVGSFSTESSNSAYELMSASTPKATKIERRRNMSRRARSRHCETLAYFAAVAAFSINAATSRACERKIAWLPGSSMVWD